MGNFAKKLLFISIIFCCLPVSSQVWNRQIIDSTGNNIGMYCTLALDQSDNPIIVYVDGDYLDLRLIEYKNNKWNRYNIDTSGYTGWSAGIALDKNNVPHVCFENGAYMFEPASVFGINYMKREQNNWIREAIEEWQVHVPSSSTYIALTSEGVPVIGYNSVNDGYYYLAFKTGESWIKKKSPYKNITAIGLKLKSDNTPVILFNKGDTFMFVTYNESINKWNEFSPPNTYKTFFSSVVRDDMDFELDKNDNIHLVGNFIDYTAMPFFYVKYVNYNWTN
ncbi:MAG: hypothetical protein JW717_11055 [Marinilabiliaceae bacterium]|nr:hypothetical protein [Marinilabiliaceae bacterium]